MFNLGPPGYRAPQATGPPRLQGECLQSQLPDLLQDRVEAGTGRLAELPLIPGEPRALGLLVLGPLGRLCLEEHLLDQLGAPLWLGLEGLGLGGLVGLIANHFQVEAV